MEKLAQERSWSEKEFEKSWLAHPFAMAKEKVFKPDFEKMMIDLRQTDNEIRAIAAGTEIKASDDGQPDASPGEDPVPLKEILKEAKSNFSKREYIKAFGDLGRFHKKAGQIANKLSLLRGNIDSLHESLLFGGVEPGDTYSSHLHDIKERMRARANLERQFIKEALSLNEIIDFVMSSRNERSQAMYAWEKDNPRLVAPMRKALDVLIKKSEVLYAKTISSLKKLSGLRQARKFDAYTEEAKEIIKAYEAYDKGDGGFEKFYKSFMKNYFEKREFKKSEEPTEVIKSEPAQTVVPELEVKAPASKEPKDISKYIKDFESGSEEVSEKPFSGVLPPPLPGNKDYENQLQNLKANLNNAMKNYDEALAQQKAAPPKQKSDANKAAMKAHEALENARKEYQDFAKSQKVTASHQSFFSSLEALSEEHPYFLAQYIKKYAISIQLVDPATAKKLFNVVKSIKG